MINNYIITRKFAFLPRTYNKYDKNKKRVDN